MKKKNIRKRGALVLSFASVLAAGCGAPAEDGSAPAWQRAALATEARLGLTRQHHGDGTYSYRLPPGVATPARRKRGALTLRYDGQARFETVPTRATAQMVYVAPEPEAAGRDPLRGLIGSVSVDNYGRRWVVEAADRDQVAARVAEYDAEVERTFGKEPADEGVAAPAAPPEEGRWALWRPLGWNRSDCDGNGTDDKFVYDSDDRNVSSNPMTDRQKKVLLLQSPAGTCSGTMVTTEWLLTAAHCVTNGSGNAYDETTISACTLGNYQTGARCYGVDDVTVAPGWNGSGMNDDYAVVHLTGLPGVGWMAISQASDSTIKNEPGRNIGYPGRKPNCTSNATAAVNAGFSALIQYFSSGDVTGLSRNRIKTNVDLSGGHSGGPFYYCPSGCTSGASHYLTGVVSGHHNDPLDSYNGGPKGPAIRTWVISNTP